MKLIISFIILFSTLTSQKASAFTTAANIPVKSISYNSMSELIQSYNSKVLNAFNADSLTVIEYMKAKNADIIEYLCTNYPINFKKADFDVNDSGLPLLASIHASAEQKGLITHPRCGTARQSLGDCIQSVVLGFFDLTSLVDDYAALIRNGASWSSVRTIVWRTIKRYGGWWAGVACVAEIISDCF